MARPNKADSEETKRKLLNAAAASFSQNGWRGTSLRQVATEAGVTLATIHHYFGNKDALYAASLNAIYDGLSVEAQPLLEVFARLKSGAVDLGKADANSIVAELMRGAFHFARDHRSLIQLLMRPVVETGELDARWRDKMLVPFLDQMCTALSEALGNPRDSYRLPLQSLVSLTMRFALSSDRELARLAGVAPPQRNVSEQGAQLALAEIESFLISLAQQLILHPVITHAYPSIH
jgi:AcrR family transcriptional regulator